MLEECIYYLGMRTACRGARRLGYLYEAAALEARHRRCRNPWLPHIQATQRSLLAAARCVNRSDGTAVIVGGGIIRDLPLSGLLEHFERIVLLDIVFDHRTRQFAKRFPNRILCCCHDVTGIVDWLAERRCLPPPELWERPGIPELAATPCWVASVNCLTQLPILPVNRLVRLGVSENVLEAFERDLIRAHLAWLAFWQTPVCLITEVEYQRRSHTGMITEITDYRPLLQDFRQGAACVSRWSWCVHPPGELPNREWETRTVETWLCP